jgi:hypothetical protein
MTVSFLRIYLCNQHGWVSFSIRNRVNIRRSYHHMIFRLPTLSPLFISPNFTFINKYYCCIVIVLSFIYLPRPCSVCELIPYNVDWPKASSRAAHPPRWARVWCNLYSWSTKIYEMTVFQKNYKLKLSLNIYKVTEVIWKNIKYGTQNRTPKQT